MPKMIQKLFPKSIFIILLLMSFACIEGQNNSKIPSDTISQKSASTDSIIVNAPIQRILPGAEQPEEYLKLLQGKNVGLVVNQSSTVGEKHLLDFLLENRIKVVKIYAPEHGFRGNIDRGKDFDDSVDKQTGVPIVAMFGKSRKPSVEQVSGVDVMVFDIQDVGVRFFTYISSMHNVMEICAETGKEMIILDRPNPLGDYIDGPIRKEKYKSFVGMHPIPIVHGLTVGELAQMINGEKWLSGGLSCKLTVIKVKNYKHSDDWSLPVKPSPNLPNDLSIRLYPSLCLFEATSVSIGRGTEFPFQVIGFPDSTFGEFSFIPVDKQGMETNPLHENLKCYGIDLRNIEGKQFFTLKYFIDFYSKFEDKSKFLTRENWFNLLAGNNELIKQISSGMSEVEIKKSWKPELEAYNKMRMKYLIYE